MATAPNVTPIKPPNNLASAMALAFGEIEGATKSANNPHFKSKYADLTAVIDAIKPALIAHDLFFTQRPLPSENGITVTTFLHHASGETMELGALFVPANKNDAQGFGSALTYARRYALVTAFGVPVEDDDGNAATQRRGAGTDGYTGENPPPPSRQTGVKLEGKYTSITALEAAIKKFVGEMDKCVEWTDWQGLRADNEGLLQQAQRDHPDWWNGWVGQPDRFVPLSRKIELLEATLAQHMTDVARS